MQILVDLAAQFDRKVAFVGRGVIENSEIAQRLGYLRDPGRRADPRHRGPQLRRRRTSSASAPARRASRRRRCRASRSTITATSSSSPDDVVVFSAREIPGNEKAIGRVMNHIARRGAEVDLRGHQARPRVGPRQRGRAEAVLSLVRPRYFVPIHGEYRAAGPARADCQSGVPEDHGPAGRERRRASASTRRAARIADKVPAGRVLIDGTRSGEVGDEVLRDRPPPVGRRPGRPGRRHRPAVGHARGDAGRDHARLRARRADRGVAEGDPDAARRHARGAPASRNAPTPG